MPDSDAPGQQPFENFFTQSLELLGIIKEGRFDLVNPAWEEHLGWSADELVSTAVLDLVHPEDESETRTFLEDLGAEGSAGSCRNRFRHQDGSYRSLEWSATKTGDAIICAARDVSRYVEANERAERNQALASAILTTAVDPIVIIDSRGIIQETNRSTSVLFGYSYHEMNRQNVSMLMPEPYHSEHDGYLAHYMETGEARIIGKGREVEARKKDGTVFPMSLAVSEVRYEGERLFTGIIHDLTARDRAHRALEEVNERLEERVRQRTDELKKSNLDLARSNRDLEQFAYIASHDLQAPLRNVRQGLELLDEHLTETVGSRFDEEADELRGLILGAVSRMEDLIRGLLSYARVQRDAHPAGESVDLRALAEDVLNQLAPDLRDSDATITVHDLPVVLGDETQLRQLLQNLIQNAIKYRPDDGPPVIEIHASPDGDSDRWVITVADNGIGIDVQHHERIFELFRRGHPGYDGVGLGLAICQRIVERHGGNIWVESAPGAGASFRFTL